ncbi:MAG: xylan 1,4-beta-xylosidase [Ruminococcaceae bacterium]|nr:xylan 1,4-beta-xylosidase [Oscillospiraceae bacterium]
MAKDEKRFVKVWSDGAFGSNEIWVDKETGVNYLFHASGYAGGLTPLLNRDGTPVVTPVPRDYEE